MLNRVMLNKKLNACDLMIGDWCLTDINSWIDDEYNPKCGVKDYQPYRIERGEDLDYIDNADSPVLGLRITRDILNNNFIKHNGLSDEWVITINILFEYTVLRDCGNGIFTINIFKASSSDKVKQLIKFEYVHELQHYLKLFNIEQEIKL